MSKKISEKELNNVSGGCGGDDNTLYHKLYCFDSNNVQIGSVVVTPRFSNKNDADKSLFNKSEELYLGNANIAYIKWELYDGSEKKESGSNNRERFFNYKLI